MTRLLASSWKLLCLVFVLILAGGCASTQVQSRPFFQPEQELQAHGRKTWFDQVVEFDPGHATAAVAPDYQEHPPLRIAVLPFMDHSNGEYLVDKIPFSFRNEEKKDRWAWTHSNRVRRAFTGDLATREFVIIPLLTVDAVLAEHGVTNWDKLKGVSYEELGRWLNADTVVYGELLSYEAYYGFLASAWRVTAKVRMVSTVDGHEIYSCTDRRFSSSVLPAIDPIDIGINSILTFIHLRDISLARTEEEVGREIVLRLPKAEHNIAEIQAEAKEAQKTTLGGPLPSHAEFKGMDSSPRDLSFAP
ncbi:MAG TPA: GNA1162 family protein [Thermodesulfobacteriota bacterium]|nr:GNA1162 family protein [Thermodesulfobacteriota bacterium]